MKNVCSAGYGSSIQSKSILPNSIEELPEEINIEMVTGRWGPKKKTTKRKAIKKWVGDKQEEIQ